MRGPARAGPLIRQARGRAGSCGPGNPASDPAVHRPRLFVDVSSYCYISEIDTLGTLTTGCSPASTATTPPPIRTDPPARATACAVAPGQPTHQRERLLEIAERSPFTRAVRGGTAIVSARTHQ